MGNFVKIRDYTTVKRVSNTVLRSHLPIYKFAADVRIIIQYINAKT